MNTSFWGGNLTETAKRVWELFPVHACECVALAEEICQNRFVFRGHWEMERTHVPVCFEGDIRWESTPNGDMEWVYALNRHSFAPLLGQAWRLTGERRFAQAVVRLLRDWLARVPLTDMSAKTAWRPIEAGIRCENWLRAAALFDDCPDFTEEMQGELAKSLSAHAEWLLDSHGSFQILSNWGVLQNHGLYLLGLAFQRDDWRGAAVSRLEAALQAQVMTDGSHWEQSPMYHGEVLHCCLDVLHAAKAARHTLPDGFIKRTHALASALAVWLRPDGLLLCQSDSDEIDARDLLTKAAILFSDPELKAYADGKLFPQTLWDFGADIPERYAALEQSERRGSVSLPDSGNTMLWDGTGNDAGFLHFRCGTLGSGHGHADLLHVDLVCWGESILADAGRYTYVESKLRKQLKGPAAHNTTRMDGLDFTGYRSTWESEPIALPVKGEYRFTPEVDYAWGAHLGYHELGVFTERRVLRLGRGLWLIWDAFHTSGCDDTHIYERNFQFGSEGELTLCADGAVYTGKHCSARLLLPDDDLRIRQETRPISREYNRLEKGGYLSVTASRQGSCGFAAVIATGEMSPTNITAELLEVRLTQSGRVLSPEEAYALHIDGDCGEWTVILCLKEVISGVSLLTAGVKTGYGKTLVFRAGDSPVFTAF